MKEKKNNRTNSCNFHESKTSKMQTKPQKTRIGLNNEKHQSHLDKMFECFSTAIQVKMYDKFDPNPGKYRLILLQIEVRFSTFKF